MSNKTNQFNSSYLRLNLKKLKSHLKNKYGKTETQGYAKVYANKDAMNLIETKPSLDRHKNVGEAPKKEKVAEATPEEPNEEEAKEAEVAEEEVEVESNEED